MSVVETQFTIVTKNGNVDHRTVRLSPQEFNVYQLRLGKFITDMSMYGLEAETVRFMICDVELGTKELVPDRGMITLVEDGAIHRG